MRFHTRTLRRLFLLYACCTVAAVCPGLGACPRAVAQLANGRPAIQLQPGQSGQSGQASGSAGAPAAVGSTGVVDGSTYVLSPDDVIQVLTFKEPTLSGQFPIRPDGMISMSLIGDVRAAGLTPTALAADVATRLAKFIQNPNVTVSVISVQPKEIFLLGEAAHVGPVLLFTGMSPLQAISAAGGLTPYANSKKIYILRTVAGKQVKVPFNYRKAVKTGDQQGVVLMPGDTIVIP